MKATLEFERPAWLDDLLEVRASIPRLGNSSFTGRFRVCPYGSVGEDEACLEAEVIYVSFSDEEGQAVPIPGWARERIGSLENSAG